MVCVLKRKPEFEFLEFHIQSIEHIATFYYKAFKHFLFKFFLDSDLDVKELLSKLQKSGILKQLAKTEEPSTSKTLAASSPARGASPPVPSNHRLDIIERRPNPSTAMKEFNMRTFF